MSSIRVKVGTDGSIDVGERTVPRMRLLLPYLPPESRRGARIAGSAVSAVANNRVSPQDMANALCAYYAAQEHPGEAVYPPGDMGGSAYFASGDTLYQLVPLRRVSGQRALVTIRERLRSECRVECEELRTRAQGEVSAILEQAAIRARDLRQEAERILSQARSEDSYKLPDWLWEVATGQHDLHVSPQSFAVPFMLRMHVTDFRYFTRRWTALPNSAFFVKCYLPIQWRDGLYNLEQVSAVDTSLPHMNGGSACVKLGDAPCKIASAQDFNRVTRGISRAFETVNLASLLCKNWRDWPESVQSAIPSELRTYFEHSGNHDFRGAPEGGEEVEETAWNL